MAQQKFDLEDRLVDFTCKMCDVVEALPDSRTGNYLAAQLINASYSPALNYAEVEEAKTEKDFLGRLLVILKALKQCRTLLKVIGKKTLIKPASGLDVIFKETQVLITLTGKKIAAKKIR